MRLFVSACVCTAIFVSATPDAYEIAMSGGDVVEQVIIEVPQSPALPAPFDPTVDLAGHLPNGLHQRIPRAPPPRGGRACAGVVGVVVQGV